MSHDQKPARVRVMGSGDAAASRRRHDAPPVVIDGNAGSAAASPGVGADGRAKAGGVSPLILALLFLVACAAGGVAVAWSGIA